MLMIPLARLEREGTLEIQAEIPPDDPSWDGTDLRFSKPLSISGHAQQLTGGDILVRLTLQGEVAEECRRCLEPVTVPIREEFTLLFEYEGEGVREKDEVRLIPSGAADLELGEALREEVVLSYRPFAVCRKDCKGLCPRCGQNLNEETCQCSDEEPDPRWDALRALNEERE